MELITREKIVSSEARTHVVAEGLTIDELLVSVDWSAHMRPWTMVTINGHEIYREYWHQVRPKPGQKVMVAVRPAGGGGGGSSKGLIAAVASIAIMIVAAIVAPYIAPVIGLTGLVGATAANAIVAAGISIVGSLALGALIKPSGLAQKTLGSTGGSGTQSVDESSTYSITGSSNTIDKYGVVPRIYGRHRFTPKFAADPYLISAGAAQTVYLLLDFGYGPVMIEDLRIGTTPISDYPSAEYFIHPEFKAGDPLVLYTNDVQTSQVNAVLSEDVDNVRTVSQEGTQLWIEIGFPAGLIDFDAQAMPRQQFETITLEIADPATPDSWVPFSNYQNSGWFQGEGGVDSTGRVTVGTYPIQYWLTNRTACIVRVPADAKPPGMGMFMDYNGETLYVMSALRDPPDWSPDGGKTNIVFDETQYQLTLNKLPSAGSGVAGIMWPLVGQRGNATIWYNKGLGAQGPITMAFGPGASEIRFAGETRSPRALSIVLNMWAEKDWLVKVRRITPVSTSTNTINAMQWNSLRSVRFQPPIAPKAPRTIMEMRVTASENISGQIQNINALCTSVLLDPRVGERVPTRNPAWIYADILTGTANSRAIPWSMLHEAELIEWANENDAAFNDEDPTTATCDLVVDFRTTIGELCQTVCATGLAAPAIQDGLYSVIRDKGDRVPVQMFTNRNARGFTTTRKWVDSPHALKVRHIDEDTWEKIETFVYADGYNAQNATIIESLDIMGVVRGKQLWRAGRYFYAAGVLRKERMIFDADIENLVCQRGDLILVAHDVLLANVVGRVRGVDNNILELDIFLDVAPAAIQARDYEGYVLDPEPLLRWVDSTHVEVSQGLANRLQAGCIVAFGDMENTTSEWVVDAIRPGNDLSARIEAIEYAPAIYDASSGPVPPYVPPDGTGFLERLSGVSNLILNTSQFIYNEVGLPINQIIVDWDLPLNWKPTEYQVERLILGPSEILNANVRTVLGVVTDTQFTDYVDAQRLSRTGTLVRYFVTPVADSGRRGAEIAAEATLYPDLQGPPEIALSCNVLYDMTVLWWLRPVDVPDLAYYQIRFTPDPSQTDWSEMTIVAERISANTTSLTVTTRVGVYAIRAVDTSGNWSPSSYVRVAIYRLNTDLPLIQTGAPEWTGRFENTEVVNGELRLKQNTDGSYPAEGWFYSNKSVALFGVWRVRIVGNVDAYAVPEGVDPLGNMDVDVMVTTSLEAPVLEDPWFDPLQNAAPLAGAPGNFTPLSATTHTTVEMRTGSWALRLLSFDAVTTPSIRSAEVEWFMDTRQEHGADEPTVNGVLSVTYAFPFYNTPGLTVTLNDGQKSDYIVRTANTRQGFTVEVRGSNDQPVNHVVHLDWVAIGYGQEQSQTTALRGPLLVTTKE